MFVLLFKVSCVWSENYKENNFFLRKHKKTHYDYLNKIKQFKLANRKNSFNIS